MSDRFTWKSHSGAALATIDGSTVIDCDACRFRHVVPIPPTVDLSHVRNGDDDSSSDADRYVFFERLWPDYFDVTSIQRLLDERFEVQAALRHGGTVTVVARKPAKRVTLGAGLA
jgi:hypothetical protein